MKTKRQVSLRFLREPLLIEIGRRCKFPDCGGRTQIGLTKSEVIEYRGFDCKQCERWNDDRIGAGEAPPAWLDQIPGQQS